MRIFRVLALLWPLAAQAETDADLQAFLTAPANPLNLAISADDGAARTTMIGPKGGTLELTNTAGDRFTLTFPAGALLTGTRITAIPISDTTGLPDGAGPITGLVLQPDGLELARTATLEITPKTPIPPESRLHWGFYEDGKDAFLHIPMQGTDKIIIPINHFSGAGIGFADRLNLQLDRWRQKSLQDRISTQIAELVRAAEKGGGTSDANAEDLRKSALRVLNHGADRIAFSAASTCADVKELVNLGLSVERQRALLGIETSAVDPAAMARLMDQLWSLCFAEEVETCLATGDLAILVRFLLSFERNKAIFGQVEAGPKDAQRVSELRAALERCGRFKLTVSAKGHWEDGVGVYGDVDFTVEVPIRIEFAGPESFYFDLVGEAPATDVNITFVDYACWVLETYRQGAPMQVRVTDLIFDKEHAPKRVTLAMKGPQLFAVTSCTSKKRGKKTIESPVSESTWGIAHAGNRSGPGYVLKTMKAGAHPKLFSYSWEGKGTAYNVTSNDTTKLVLEHVGG